MIREKANLYSIGTVIELGDNNTLYTITGYFRATADGRVKDYSGVRFPDGDAGPDAYLLFDQEDISHVISKGYCDPDYELFAEHIAEVESEMHNRVQEAINLSVMRMRRSEFKGLD